MENKEVESYKTLKSYKLNIVSEHLQDRHPYLELPFNDRYNPSEVYRAVFDREIPKLAEILQMKHLPDENYRDALITLTELVSHQENKDMMITQGIVEIASGFLASTHLDVRREAMLLLGSLLSMRVGRERVNEATVAGIRSMLFDEHREGREACGWTVCRIAISRDGVDIINNNKLTTDLISSFLKYTEELKDEEAQFMIYLLESFGYILEFDQGITFFLGSGILNRVNSILAKHTETIFSEFKHRIHSLCLEFETKFTMNHDGKEEGITEEIIYTAYKFLHSSIFEEVKFAVMTLMSCSILLEGKQQCTNYNDQQILKDLTSLLPHPDKNLHRYVKNTLLNISEYPPGVQHITILLAPHFEFLDEIFGIKIVKWLALMLPKANELIQPPIEPTENFSQLKLYCQDICSLIKNHKDQVKIAIQDTVRLTERIIPFLLVKTEKNFQELVAQTLLLICNADIAGKEVNAKEEIRNYLENYGEVRHPTFNTTLNDELSNFTRLSQALEK
jgi:hypothetical protein